MLLTSSITNHFRLSAEGVQMGVAVGLLRGAQRSFVDVSSRVIFCCFGGGPYGRGAGARAAFRGRCGVAPRYCGL